MRTKLREYSYLYLLAAVSGISGVGAFLRGSWGFTLEATCFFFLPCVAVGVFEVGYQIRQSQQGPLHLRPARSGRRSVQGLARRAPAAIHE